MSRSLHYVFPAANNSDVCQNQAIEGAGALILNGNLANQINSEVSFIEKGYSRQLSLTSTEDLSDVIITINGMQNGIAITEDIVGPNNTTIYSVLIYDVINNISVDNAVDDISVGTGYSGFFPLIGINLEKPVINYALSIISSANVEEQIPTIVQNTLFDIVNTKPFLDLVDDENLFEIKGNNEDNDQYFLPLTNIVPCRYILIQIEGTEDTINNSVSMNFIQV